MAMDIITDVDIFCTNGTNGNFISLFFRSLNKINKPRLTETRRGSYNLSVELIYRLCRGRAL